MAMFRHIGIRQEEVRDRLRVSETGDLDDDPVIGRNRTTLALVMQRDQGRFQIITDDAAQLSGGRDNGLAVQGSQH